MLRVTINGKSAKTSLGIRVQPGDWIPNGLDAGCVSTLKASVSTSLLRMLLVNAIGLIPHFKMRMT